MFYPWNAYFGLAANIFLALVQGWTTLAPFNAGNFVDAYILLPLFPVIYVIYKWVNGTRFHRASEIDLVSGRRTDLDRKRLIPDSQDDRQMETQQSWKQKMLRNF